MKVAAFAAFWPIVGAVLALISEYSWMWLGYGLILGAISGAGIYFWDRAEQKQDDWQPVGFDPSQVEDDGEPLHGLKKNEQGEWVRF